jgi:2-polyprenyl-6-hydroxyphenyl methylase/3-demethylubiquinone-9 3-methyltransferase
MTDPAADRTADAHEVARFAALAEDWWDANGPFAPLHRLNPTRIRYVRDRIAARLGRDPETPRPLDGVGLLDIGCGGGLIAEPMARLGAQVTGIDAAAQNVAAAAHHAAGVGLDIDYRHQPVEALAGAGARFDAVLALEVVEHVADLPAFLAAASACVAPGGTMIVATLNRTMKAFAFAVLGAEYVLGWLPRGTHDWAKFLRPSELAALLADNGLDVADMTGVCYRPLDGRWALCRDLAVNYMVAAARAP